MFLGPDGSPCRSTTAVLSGRATGVPGAVGMLALAHEEHGKLAVEQPVRRCRAHRTRGVRRQPAPRAAHPRGLCRKSRAGRRRLFLARARRTPASRPATGCATRPMPNSSTRLAGQGPSALYSGSTAARIVERTRAGPLGGSMTMADLANYRPVKREALCGPYRALRAVRPAAAVERGRPAPAAENARRTDIAARGPNDPQAWFLFAEASRLMYADRDRYVGDPAFVACRSRACSTRPMSHPRAG